MDKEKICFGLKYPIWQAQSWQGKLLCFGEKQPLFMALTLLTGCYKTPTFGTGWKKLMEKNQVNRDIPMVTTQHQRLEPKKLMEKHQWLATKDS